MPYYSLNNNPVLPHEFWYLKGVYKLFALNTDGTPQPIQRTLGVDSTGLLYIGQTTGQDFKVRIDMFRRVMNPANATTAHSGALNFKEIEALRVRFPITSLFITIHPCAFPKTEESALLEAYRQEFGEVPPLNSCR